MFSVPLARKNKLHVQFPVHFLKQYRCLWDGEKEGLRDLRDGKALKDFFFFSKLDLHGSKDWRQKTSQVLWSQLEILYRTQRSRTF